MSYSLFREGIWGNMTQYKGKMSSESPRAHMGVEEVSSEFFQVPKPQEKWRNMGEIWRNMKENWRNMKEIWGNKYVENMKEIWRRLGGGWARNFSKSQSLQIYQWKNCKYWGWGGHSSKASGKMKKYGGNMAKYEGICRNYEEIWRKYEELSPKASLEREFFISPKTFLKGEARNFSKSPGSYGRGRGL